MGNTEVVHTRIDSKIKKEANKVFNKIGLNMSQAIKLFLITAINKNGMPFELKIPKEESEALKFAKSVATVDGVQPSKEDEVIFEQYANGKIDYKTYMDIIENKYKTIKGFEVDKCDYSNHTIKKIETIKKPKDWIK